MYSIAGLMRNILYPTGKATYIVKQQQNEVIDNAVADEAEKNAANLEVKKKNWQILYRECMTKNVYKIFSILHKLN